MNFIYEDHRIYANNSEGKLIVEATFPFYKKGVVVVDHTFVDPELRGQGIASKLMHEVCIHSEKLGYKMVALCPYAVVWFKRNKQYDYLIDQKLQANLAPECKI